MTFTVRIVKMDGETVFLQSNADSLMALTTHLLELVNAPKDLNVFSPQIVGPYLEQLRIATELIAEADKAGGGGCTRAQRQRPADLIPKTTGGGQWLPGASSSNTSPGTTPCRRRPRTRSSSSTTRVTTEASWWCSGGAP